MLARGYCFSPTDRNLNMGPGKVPPRESLSPHIQRPATSAAKFNSQKRKQRQDLLEAEKRKEQSERLSYVLIFRLVQKFGKKYMETITFFVEELMNSKTNITAEDVENLEKEVRQAVMLRSGRSSAKNNSNNSNNSNGAGDDQLQPITQLQRGSSSEDRPRTGEEWKLLLAYSAVVGEDEEKIARQKQRDKKLQFKQQLDEHISQSTALRQSLPQWRDEQQYAERVAADIRSFEIERKQQFLTLRERNILERAERDKQIALKAQRLEAQREQLLREEEKANRIAAAALQNENELRAQQRMSALERNERAKRENDELKRIRDEEKVKEAERDHQLMREFTAKIDRENQQRSQAFQKRMAEGEARGLKYENDGAGKALREEREREEKLLLLELQRKAAAEELREQQKQQKQQQRMAQQVGENRVQMQQRRVEAERQRVADLAVKERAKQQAVQYKLEEEERLRKYKESQERYRALLDMQVSEYQHVRSQHEEMNKVEKDINMPTIRDATEDPMMRSRVMHRLRHTKSSHGSRPKTGFW